MSLGRQWVHGWISMSGKNLKRLLMPSGVGGFGVAIGAIALASFIGLPFRDHTDADNLTMVYLTAVVAVALRSGLAPALLSAALGVAAFNFLFTPPYYTFDALNPASYLTFGFMLVSSLLAALLASGLAARLASTKREYFQVRDMLAISRSLLQATSREDVEGSLSGPIRARFGADIDLLLEELPIIGRGGSETTAPLDVPITNGSETLGVLRLTWPTPRAMDHQDRVELDTIAALAAGAVMRLRQAEFVSRSQSEKESERLRNLLLSSLGHDLRTPLTVLSGTASSLLRQRRKLPREILEDVVLLSRQIDDLQRFTANLLRMAAISSGQLTLNRQPYDIQELIGAALKRIEGIRGERMLRIEINGPLALIDADGALVEQVLVNLLENAIKHTAPDGTLLLRLERNGAMLQTSVIDDGPGIPAGEEDAIFERFQTGVATQADRSTGGHGLGLAICRGIVEAHGGCISASNGDKLGGACLSFSLPFSNPAEGVSQ